MGLPLTKYDQTDIVKVALHFFNTSFPLQAWETTPTPTKKPHETAVRCQTMSANKGSEAITKHYTKKIISVLYIYS